MPTYAYACTQCNHEFEIVQSFSDDSLTECPECTGRLRKVFSPVGVVFKGGGFYRTDSQRSDRSAKQAGAGSAAKTASKPSKSAAASSPSDATNSAKPATTSNDTPGATANGKGGSGGSATNPKSRESRSRPA